MKSERLTLWTIGHSNHGIEEFLAILQAHQIELVVDVRRYPGSRRFPHFNHEPLQASLMTRCIEYQHFPDLGGRRQPRPDSPNTAWRNEQFRGYADYVETSAFRSALERLLAAARRKRTAILCAEALWWECHRSLIADVLKADGVMVLHIFDTRKVEEHHYTSAAHLVHGKVSYAPAGEQAQLALPDMPDR